MPTATTGGASNAWEEQASVNEDGNPVSVSKQQPLPAEEPVPSAEDAQPIELPAPGAVLPEGWASADPPDATATSVPDYGSMTKSALADEAKTRELPTGGTKADLAARLTEHDAAAQQAPEAGEP